MMELDRRARVLGPAEVLALVAAGRNKPTATQLARVSDVARAGVEAKDEDEAVALEAAGKHRTVTL